MKRRNGVILLVTLLMMMLLLGIVGVFLSKTKEAKDSVTYEFAMLQTNMMMRNVIESLREIKLDQYAIFLASQVPLPINFGLSSAVVKIDSAQKYININSLVSASINKENKKRDDISNAFISYLMKYDLKEPRLFLHILQDSVDKDSDSRSGVISEIVESFPAFREGGIFNKMHLGQMIDYYFDKSGDAKIYGVPFDEMFSFKSSAVDLNYATLELMEFLFDDMNAYVLRAIYEHQDIYEDGDLEDEFGDINVEKLLGSRMGQNIAIETKQLKVTISLKYKSQFQSDVSFECDLADGKISSIYNYSIDGVEFFD